MAMDSGFGWDLTSSRRSGKCDIISLYEIGRDCNQPDL